MTIDKVKKAIDDKQKRTCGRCKAQDPEKGRAMDGRRAYRCKQCGEVWTEGMQGARRRFSSQRPSFQFKDTRPSSPRP